MAIRFDTAGEMLNKSGNSPTVTAFTMMTWFSLAVAPAPGNFSNLLTLEGILGNYYWMGISSTPTFNTYRSGGGGSMVSGSTISANTWYHGAIVVSGTGAGQFLGYLNGVLDVTNSGEPNITSTGIRYAYTNDGGDAFNGRLASAKVYNAILTAAEIQQEMQQVLPVRTTNLNNFYPLLSLNDAATDYSGNAYDLTATGTLSTEDGPPIPWRQGRRRVLIPAVVAAIRRFLLVR